MTEKSFGAAFDGPQTEPVSNAKITATRLRFRITSGHDHFSAIYKVKSKYELKGRLAVLSCLDLDPQVVVKGGPATDPSPFAGSQPSFGGFGGGGEPQQKSSFSFGAHNGVGSTEAKPFVFGASAGKPTNPIEEMPVGGSEVNFGFRAPPPKNERFGAQQPVQEDEENEEREEPRQFGGFRDDESLNYSQQSPPPVESPRQSHVFPGGQDVDNGDDDDDDDGRGDEVAHWMPQDDSGSGDNDEDADEDDDAKLAERFGF